MLKEAPPLALELAFQMLVHRTLFSDFTQTEQRTISFYLRDRI